MSPTRFDCHMTHCVLHGLAIVITALVMMGCATKEVGSAVSGNQTEIGLSPRRAASAPTMSGNTSVTRALPESDTGKRTASSADTQALSSAGIVQLGSGEMFRPPAARTTKMPPVGPPISLSFENGDIREIIRNIIGDLLGENYIIDPRVQGTVTMRTATPVPRADVLALLETVLRANGVALVRDGSYWRVVPSAEAIRGNAIPVPGNVAGSGRGTSVVIYTPRNIGAKELQRVIEPFAKDAATSLRTDELRNLLFVTGPQIETDRLLEIAEMFDVDLLAGMSFALYILQGSDVKSVMADYEKIVGNAATNPFGGLLRVLPIERMNAVLLVSPQAKAVQEAKKWFERLDAGGSDAGAGQRLFVYSLLFTQAEKLQPVLQAALSGRSLTATPTATVAPGQSTTTLSSPINPLPGQSLVQPGNIAPRAPTLPVVSGGATQGSALARNANIIADKDRNALLIVATQAEYAAIEAVIRKLDVAPKQVAIEVQIAEVQLVGDFAFGLQTYFQGKALGAQNRLTSENGFGQIVGGVFNYTWKKTDAIQAILNLSETKKNLRVISQPTLITVENQKATFASGKQISVRTQTSTNTSITTGSVDSYQYINTGINVSVTPRVSGNNVFLEIQQEISDSSPSAVASNPNPDISKSSATTNVMVGSGDTMLMGGLFQEKGSTSSTGLPFVSSIPILGGLFGQQGWTSNRTELVLLITPRVLSTTEETRGVVDELRKRLRSIEETAPSASTSGLPTRAEDRAKLAADIRALNGSLGGVLKTPEVTPGAPQ